jgi:hypothetical protein
MRADVSTTSPEAERRFGETMRRHKKFQRRVEDFHCGRCGREVQGDGYTNHCPACLYSMHVDVNPGDRAESCRGLMAPVDYEVKGAEYVVVHQCTACGAIRRNKMRPEDSMQVLLGLARTRAAAAARERRPPFAARAIPDRKEEPEE